jgi:hypothetical protein
MQTVRINISGPEPTGSKMRVIGSPVVRTDRHGGVVGSTAMQRDWHAEGHRVRARVRLDQVIRLRQSASQSAPARRGGGAPGTTGKYDSCRSFGSSARLSRPGWADLPRIRPRTAPTPRRPSCTARTSGSSPAARVGSPMPGCPRTVRCAPGTGTMSPTAISSSFVSSEHFEGWRGGRPASR